MFIFYLLGAEPITSKGALYIDDGPNLKKQVVAEIPSLPIASKLLAAITGTEHFGKLTLNNKTITPQRPFSKYLFILGHYEQLGKTTINFLHAGYLAAKMGRNLVIPYVRNSRYCGLRAGWTGQKRKKSREFLPMSNYFDMASVHQIFREEKLSPLISLDKFREVCGSKDKKVAFVTFFHDIQLLESIRYLSISRPEYKQMLKNMQAGAGWQDCSFIEDRIHTGPRIGGINIGPQLCVNAEQVTDINFLENSILNNTECVAVHLWRGVGHQRTHFNVSLNLENSSYLSRLTLSKVVIDETNKFILKHFGTDDFLSIQVRSERQLSWYSLRKFQKCMDLVIKVAKIILEKKQIKHVFVSSDLDSHGSDQMVQLLNASTLLAARQYYESKVSSLKSVTFKPNRHRDYIHNDSGYVALAQMNIISRSVHLITLGDGTFQRWLIASFKKQKKNHDWSITRACSQETKEQWNKKGRTASNVTKSKHSGPLVVRESVPFR